MIALTSPTGKLGGAVLSAILDNNLIDTKELIVCTSSPSSSPKLEKCRGRNLSLRHADFNDPSTLEEAYKGCEKLFLVSTPAIEMDYNDAPLWQGREKHHRAAIDAALKVGVKHIFYTSLAFRNPSKAGVMRAHIRTEKYLHELENEDKVKVTVIREGLYNESWPLYFGYYFGLKSDQRKEVVVAGDGKVSWTAIQDMAFCTAKIVCEPSDKWAGNTFYLSQQKSHTLQDIAGMVSKRKGVEVKLKIVGRKEHEDYYVNEKGMDRAAVEWWSSTYDALKDGECNIEDPLLDKILEENGKKPKSLEETIEEMMQ